MSARRRPGAAPAGGRRGLASLGAAAALIGAASGAVVQEPCVTSRAAVAIEMFVPPSVPLLGSLSCIEGQSAHRVLCAPASKTMLRFGLEDRVQENVLFARKAVERQGAACVSADLSMRPADHRGQSSHYDCTAAHYSAVLWVEYCR